MRNNVTNLSGSISAGYNGFHHAPEVGWQPVTNTFYPLQTAGAANCYLTNGCAFLASGTANVDPYGLSLIRQKTTWPPVVYSDAVLITATNLGPQAARDTTAPPTLGYHYDPLDYMFGGCDLSASVTFTAGTAVGWYEDYGQGDFYGVPYGLALNDGASVTFAGTASLPCQNAQNHLVQEGNGNCDVNGWMAGFVLNGSGAPPIPRFAAQFTHFSGLYDWSLMRDWWDYGVCSLANCELYVVGAPSYLPSYYFTNCLLWRTGFAFYSQVDAASVTYQNCTFLNGGLCLCRYAGQSPSFWTIINTTFDGTAFLTADNLGGATNSTLFDYNAYNTGNTNWENFNFGVGIPGVGTLETIGPNDLTVTNGYNWQTGLLGNFYLPTNSTLIDMGSDTAADLGLGTFTTQTNQVPDTAQVDIGYHYPVSGYIRNGLLAYWRLNDGSGSVAVDCVGGNNLTLYGSPVWGTNYLTFNGTNQYGDAGSRSALDITGDITLCAWVNSASFPASGYFQVAVEKGLDNYNEGFYMRYNGNSATLDGGSFNDSAAFEVTVPNVYSLGQWYFITIV